MTFRYDRSGLRVIDDATGIEIYQHGRGEVNLWQFAFSVPKNRLLIWKKWGEFDFYAAPVERTLYVEDGDRKRAAGLTLEGFKINEAQLWTALVRYTDGDKRKFAKARRLISLGLQEWLRKRDGIENPEITFERVDGRNAP